MPQKYYYDTGDEQIGPVTGSELARLRATGQLAPDTWVRKAESKTWRPLSGIDLRKEEADEANSSLWRLLWRSLSWSNILLLISLAIVLIFLVAGIVKLVWPILLVLVLLGLIMRTLR